MGNWEVTFTGGAAVFVILCVTACLLDTILWLFKREKKIIKKARKFAKRKHKGQKDDEGEDYFKAHLQHTVDILKHVTKSTSIIVAGYLHDTLEDTDTTYAELQEEFSDNVARIVYEVTHEGEKDTGYSFPRLKSKDAILVKFADRLSNLSRMYAWTPERQEQYLEKSKFWASQL